MRRLVCALLIGSVACQISAAPANEGVERAKKEMQAVFDGFVPLYRRAFSYQLTSSILTNMAAMPGTPLAYVLMRNTAGHAVPWVELPWMAEPYRKKLEELANNVFSKSSYYGLFQKSGFGFIYNALNVMLQQEKNWEVIKDTDRVLDVEVVGMESPFIEGKKIRAMRVRLDRTRKVPEYVRMTFEQDRYFGLQIEYQATTVPGLDRPMLLPVRTIMDQTVFPLENPSGLGLPAQFPMEFTHYVFE